MREDWKEEKKYLYTLGLELGLSNRIKVCRHGGLFIWIYLRSCASATPRSHWTKWNRWPNTPFRSPRDNVISPKKDSVGSAVYRLFAGESDRRWISLQKRGQKLQIFCSPLWAVIVICPNTYTVRKIIEEYIVVRVSSTYVPTYLWASAQFTVPNYRSGLYSWRYAFLLCMVSRTKIFLVCDRIQDFQRTS